MIPDDVVTLIKQGNIDKLIEDWGDDFHFLKRSRDQDGYTMLSLAVMHGHANIVLLLLQNGANIDAISKGLTPLIWAAENGREDMVTLLLDNKANVAFRYGDETVLMRVASKGHIDVVRLLLARGSNVNEASSNGDTVLMNASKNGRLNVVKLLLEQYGKDINVDDVNDTHTTALMMASENGHIDVVRALLEKGASLEATSDIGARSPLQCAALKGRIDIVELLLDNGADINFLGIFHPSPLGCAIQKRNESLVNILLNRGAEIGRNDLNDAIKKGNLNIVKTLLKNDAIIKYDSLKLAEGNGQIIALLLANGADIDDEAIEGGDKEAAFAADGLINMVTIFERSNEELVELTDVDNDLFISRLFHRIIRESKYTQDKLLNKDLIKLLFQQYLLQHGVDDLSISEIFNLLTSDILNLATSKLSDPSIAARLNLSTTDISSNIKENVQFILKNLSEDKINLLFNAFEVYVLKNGVSDYDQMIQLVSAKAEFLPEKLITKITGLMNVNKEGLDCIESMLRGSIEGISQSPAFMLKPMIELLNKIAKTEIQAEKDQYNIELDKLLTSFDLGLNEKTINYYNDHPEELDKPGAYLSRFDITFECNFEAEDYLRELLSTYIKHRMVANKLVQDFVANEQNQLIFSTMISKMYNDHSSKDISLAEDANTKFFGEFKEHEPDILGATETSCENV